jgi:hypothetical protein
MDDDDDEVIRSSEFLNCLEIPVLPKRILKLEIFALMMCFRNTNQPAVCNSARWLVK